MTGSLKRGLSVGVVLGLAVMGSFSCNEGVDGFHAEYGSSVVLSQPQGAETNIPVACKMTVTVLSSLSEPASDIQMEIFSTECSLFDKAEGESEVTLNFDRLQQTDNPLITKTGSRGTREIVVLCPAPADLGLDEYEANFNADIGVASGFVTWSIESPDSE